MGCLSVNLSRVDNAKIDVTLLRYPASLRAWRDNVEITIMRFGNASVITERRSGLKITCGLICSINTAKHLRVEPKNIWLTPGNMFSDCVLVVGNIDWKVEQ